MLNIHKIPLLFLLSFLLSVTTFAQSAADKILGNYHAVFSRNEMNVKVFKYQDGYRMQIYWMKRTHNNDGTLKVDKRNPDVSKRNTPLTKVILIDKVIYKDGIWKDGRIYDPEHGRTYKVELKLTDSKTLEVKGKLGPFHKCMYWTRTN